MEELKTAMRTEEKVFSYIEKYQMIPEKSHVIVGISGGADSVCLLKLLKEYKKLQEFQLCAVHVNHHIRGEEAIRDEEFSKEVCQRLEVPFSVFHYHVPEIARERKISLEEAGRELRREAFKKAIEDIESSGKKIIALAHHENDNAETILHNLLRGSGAAGLGGIRPVSGENGEYIRPLLFLKRAEIEEYLRIQGISWITDSTNEETEYTRNKIRHQIIPVMEEINPRAVTCIGRAAENMWKIEEYLQEQTDILYGKYVKKIGDMFCIKKECFLEKEIMQSYLIMRVLEEASKGKKNITAAHIEAVRGLFKGRTGASVSLAWGVTASQVYGDVHIQNKKVEEVGIYTLEWEVFPYEKQQIPEKTYTKWFDYDKINSSLSVRHRLQGDYLVINQKGGRKKLKDYLIDCKIPRQERDKLTLLADGSRILWVVGYRISESYKVTSQTKQILKVQVKGVEENE